MCLSVHDHIVGTARPIFIKFFVHVINGCGLVFFWRRNDMLCTSGLWMTSYLLISQGCSTPPPSWSAVHTQPWVNYKLRSNTSYRPTDARHGTTFRALKVASQVATPAVESAVYDCRVTKRGVGNMSPQMPSSRWRIRAHIWNMVLCAYATLPSRRLLGRFSRFAGLAVVLNSTERPTTPRYLQECGTKVRRYNWHSVGSLGWPFPMLK